MTNRFTLALVALAAASPVLAQTTVQDAWVRGTVPEQKATGAFLQITSTQGAKLVGASSPVAKVVEVHEMAMEGSVMRMRAVKAVPLPAGQAVQLKPGGFHIMLMDLKQRLKDGDTVDLALEIEGADGRRETLKVQAPVRPLAQSAGSIK